MENNPKVRVLVRLTTAKGDVCTYGHINVYATRLLRRKGAVLTCETHHCLAAVRPHMGVEGWIYEGTCPGIWYSRKEPNT